MNIVYVLFCEGKNDWNNFSLNIDKKGIKGDYTNTKLNWMHLSLIKSALSNSTNTLHLISNLEKIPESFPSNIVLHNIYDYIDDDCKEFDRLYVHLSSLPYTQELFCFKRAFVLKSFAIKNNLTNFFHAEIDNVIYMNLLEQSTLFNKYDLTLSVEKSAHGMWVNNNQALIDFCNMLIAAYSGKYFRFNVDNMKIQIQNNIAKGMPGGVTDMHFWQYYYWDHKNTVLPEITTSNRFAKTGIYDRHIRSDLDKWEGEDSCIRNYKFQCKKFEFNNNIPYCKCLIDNEYYPFVTIHFNSCTKDLIKDYVNK